MTTGVLFLFFLSTPLGIYALIVGFLFAPSKSKHYVFFLGLAFGLIAYCTTPLRTIDITRYFQQLDSIRDLPFSQAVNWADDGLVIKNIVFWLVSQTKDNRILPFISIFTVYVSASYIIIDSCGDNKRIARAILLFQLMAIPFYHTYSNVRNVSAFALLAVAVYRDMVKKKRTVITYLLYIIPCFIHMSGIVIVLFRAVIPIIRRFPYLGITSTLVIPTVIINSYSVLRRIQFPGYVGQIVNRAIWKAYSSTVATSDYAVETQSHGSFLAGRLVAFVFCVGLLLFVLSEIKRKRTERVYDYQIFVGVLISMTLLWSIMGVVKYWVLLFFVYIICTPVIIWAFNDPDRKVGLRQKLLICVIVFSNFLSFLLQLRVIYRSLDLQRFSVDILTTNYIVVFIRAIKGFFAI